jgi:hypothetical protein
MVLGSPAVMLFAHVRDLHRAGVLRIRGLSKLRGSDGLLLNALSIKDNLLTLRATAVR